MDEGTVAAAEAVPDVYIDPLGLKKLANYLRSVDGILVRDGIEHDKRVQFFKGIYMPTVCWICICSNACMQHENTAVFCTMSCIMLHHKYIFPKAWCVYTKANDD
jgi:hypothetical protein